MSVQMAERVSSQATSLVPLAEVLRERPADHVPVPGFAALSVRRFVPATAGCAEGDGGTVTAVLERTAVVELGPEQRRLASLDDVLVDPATIEWRPRGAIAKTRRRGAAGDVAEERPAVRSRAGGAPDQTPPALVRGPLPEPEAGYQVVEAEASPASPVEVDHEDGADPGRWCRVCGGELPKHNHKGICTACQGICPSCGGRKAIQARRCRACRRAEAPTPATEALQLIEAFGDLPDCVQEVLDQVVALARYARDLEDEIARYRAAERGVKPW